MLLRLRFDFDQVMIFLILIFTFLNSYAHIASTTAGMPAFWSRAIMTFKLIILGLDVIYVIGWYIANKRIAFHASVINTYLYLFYMCVPTLLFIHPSLPAFMADAFAWPFTYIAYYLYAKKHTLTSFYRRGLAIACVLTAYAMVRCILARDLKGTNVGGINRLVAYLPMVLLLFKKQKLSRLLLIVVIVSVTLFSLKRAAALSVILGFVAYYACYMILNRGKKAVSTGMKAILVMAVVLAIVMYSDIGNNLLARFETMGDDEGSGRYAIWRETLEAVGRSSTLKKMIGHGYHALPYDIRVFGIAVYAHNSYVETLYDLGYIGAVWLIGIVVWMLFSLLHSVWTKNEDAPYGAVALSIVLVISSFSYFFEDSGTAVLIASFWGMFQGSKHLMREVPDGTAPARYRYIR